MGAGARRPARATRCRPTCASPRRRAGTELGDLLERGEIDFLMTANTPLSFRRGARRCGGCFRTMRELEKDYYRRTRIYPIMHTVVIRRDVYERDPWVALSLYKALCRAKDYTYRWIMEAGSAKARRPGCSRCSRRSRRSSARTGIPTASRRTAVARRAAAISRTSRD